MFHGVVLATPRISFIYLTLSVTNTACQFSFHCWYNVYARGATYKWLAAYVLVFHMAGAQWITACGAYCHLTNWVTTFVIQFLCAGLIRRKYYYLNLASVFTRLILNGQKIWCRLGLRWRLANETLMPNSILFLYFIWTVIMNVWWMNTNLNAVMTFLNHLPLVIIFFVFLVLECLCCWFLGIENSDTRMFTINSIPTIHW